MAEKDEHPSDDLLGRLLAGPVADGTLDRERLVGTAILLLIAGHDSTANMVALGALTLLAHPEQAARVRIDLSLVAPAVEEPLRFHSIGDLVTCRVAVEDLQIGDVVVRAGEGVVTSTAAANRDPAAVERPDQLDIGRATDHLAFGPALRTRGPTLDAPEVTPTLDARGVGGRHLCPPGARPPSGPGPTEVHAQPHDVGPATGRRGDDDVRPLLAAPRPDGVDQGRR